MRAALIRTLARAPLPLLRATLGRLIAGERAAVCLHRVPDVRRAGDPVPSMSMTPAEVDGLVSLLRDSRPRSGRPWLVVTFDDGYRSAAEYVRSRAPRFPDLEWLLFVCPEKLEKRAGFRWDLFEWRRRQGEAGPSFADVMNECHDIVGENDRPELKGLADRAEFGLATVDEARALQRLPNVQVGNHGNTHFKPTRLDDDAFRSDLAASFAAFERLFGPAEHYAFPFGFPGLEFGPRHVQMARESTRAVLWTTEPGPYPPDAQRAGALLPRFPIDGRLPPRQTAAWMLLATARRRLRQSRGVRQG